ncbi:MAG: hypothetical protein ABIQ60_12205, partial [Burkholderiaceae bacterium]
MQRFAADARFEARLAAQCRLREPRFDPAEEARAVRALLADMLGERPVSAADTINATRPQPDSAP